VRGYGRLSVAGLTAGAAAWLAVLLHQRRNPAPCDYRKRFWVQLPKPFIRRDWLEQMLDLHEGERVLEVGPGTGYYAVGVAGRLEQLGGRLHILDVQQVMLDHTARAVREAGLPQVEAALGDARSLPYADGSFDAAYIMLALGEVPGQVEVLAELRRVVRRGGRVVVGELFGDPHMVMLRDLRRRARQAGLVVRSHRGGPLGYVARLEHDG
jgi:ubiquinone/menaquinone biosynthesis C-methylase UbiE